MAKKLPPVIGPIPAEIVADAAKLGLYVETHTEVIAGHGHTGRVGWSVFVTSETFPGFVDHVRLRYGADSSHENTRASLRYALDSIRAERAQ